MFTEPTDLYRGKNVNRSVKIGKDPFQLMLAAKNRSIIILAHLETKQRWKDVLRNAESFHICSLRFYISKLTLMFIYCKYKSIKLLTQVIVYIIVVICYTCSISQRAFSVWSVLYLALRFCTMNLSVKFDLNFVRGKSYTRSRNKAFVSPYHARFGGAVTQSVRLRLPVMATRVRCKVISCEICGEQRYIPNTFVSS